MNAVGVDVGAARLHCVLLSGRRVAATAVLPADEPAALVELAAGAEVVAVDAPAETSGAPHRDDPALKPKFALARCAEIALGREHGIWVPWVAPLEPPRNGWIAVGLRVFRALAAAGLRPIEVFPQAAFRVLAGGAVPPKTRPEGLAARAELLRAEVDEPSLSLWGHDGLDALVAAVVARDHAAGVAARVGCGHDASAIWLPGERRRGGAGGSDASP